MAKGGNFEREMSHFLSTWWSKDPEQDDLFWHTHGSGARATQRTKLGKKTRGQYGDICAVDARGKRLLQVFTISLKRGYSGKTFQDCIDATDKANKEKAKPEQEYAGWIREAITADRDAGSLSWLILVRRDKRQPLIIIPGRFKFYLDGAKQKLLEKIKPQWSMIAWIQRHPPLAAKQKRKMTIKERIAYNKANKRTAISVLGYPRDKFLAVVDRTTIVQIARRNEK